ncbi:MAG: hypothetical protein IJ343_01245 [Clostridia bacterium]|nr:hypothetical protein [Clostridia bacterium]
MKMNNDNRASQIDEMLRTLPAAAEQGLGGLTAGPHLKARIQLAAAEPQKSRPRLSMNLVRWGSVLSCAAVLVLVIALSISGLPGLTRQPGSLITSDTLSGNPTEVPVILTGDLRDSSVTIRAGKTNTDSMWAPASNGSFPLIGVNGKYYRMLTTPRSVPSSLLGSSVGTVAEFTNEPSLSGTNTVLSNAAAFGETVYEIRGMGNTLVAARVDGQMRLFQRVSFNGNARSGRESLEDTLQVRNRIIAMELSGVGTITDPAACSRLMELLFRCASFESSGSVSSRQFLLLELDNGLVLQMAVRNDSLAACGVWSCPEFIEAFEDACN